MGRAKPERTRQGPAAASTAAPALASCRGAGPWRGRGGVEVGQPQSAYQPIRATAEARPGALPAVAQAALPPEVPEVAASLLGLLPCRARTGPYPRPLPLIAWRHVSPPALVDDPGVGLPPALGACPHTREACRIADRPPPSPGEGRHAQGPRRVFPPAQQWRTCTTVEPNPHPPHRSLPRPARGPVGPGRSAPQEEVPDGAGGPRVVPICPLRGGLVPPSDPVLARPLPRACGLSDSIPQRLGESAALRPHKARSAILLQCGMSGALRPQGPPTSPGPTHGFSERPVASASLMALNSVALAAPTLPPAARDTPCCCLALQTTVSFARHAQLRRWRYST